MEAIMGIKNIIVGAVLSCGVFVSSLFAQETQDSIYETYQFENGKLYVARDHNGILFGGIYANGYKGCEVGLDKSSLQCGKYQFTLEKGKIVGDNAKILDSFAIKSQKIVYRQIQASPSNISMLIVCSKNPKIQNLLELMYQKEFECTNAQQVFLKEAEESMQEYLKDIGDLNVEEYLKKFPLEEITEDKLYYFDENLLVFEKMSYLYTGGAHGNHGKWGVVLSKKEGIVELNEIIDLNNLELKQILWEKYQDIAAKEKVKDYITFENFKVSDAILLSYDGIVFVYQPYEIMPYVYGNIEIKLPLEVVEKFGNFKDSPLKYLFLRQN